MSLHAVGSSSATAGSTLSRSSKWGQQAGTLQQLSGFELVCLAVAWSLLGYYSEARGCATRTSI
ncbi:hypothetical protein ACFQX6_28340 [Streptosporangium lutulentum]